MAKKIDEYGSVMEMLAHWCHIFPRGVDDQGRLLVDCERMFYGNPQPILFTVEYKIPESYDAYGSVVTPNLLYRGNVWILHYNEDGSIFCTRRPGYDQEDYLKQIAGEDAYLVPGMNGVPLTVGDDKVTIGDWEIDPNTTFAIMDGGAACARDGSLGLVAGFPQRNTMHRYDVCIPPYDPAHADNTFLPGFPYDVEVRKNWIYTSLSKLPKGTYSQARLHKGIAQMENGVKVIKEAFINLGDLDGKYPITDNHVIVRDTGLENGCVAADFYEGNGKQIKVANKSQVESGKLYTYTVDDAGVYTLVPDTTKQGDGEIVYGMISEDRFYLRRHGNKDYITTRCAVVIEENGALAFRRIAAKMRGDTRKCIHVWGPVDQSGQYGFAYVKYDT